MIARERPEAQSPQTPDGTETTPESLVPPKPIPAAGLQPPAQSADGPAGRSSPKDLALSHLTTPSQRQLVEALAEQQALSDQHPIWGIVAMLGAVISGTPVRQDLESTLAQKSDIEAVISEIHVLTAEIGSMRSQTEALSAEVKTLRALLDSHLAEITKVISGAATLNRKIPEFLEGLKAALLPRTARPPR